MLEQFKVKVPIQVRWCDIDPFLHVNNAVYLSYLELARLKYWKEVFNKDKIEDINFIIAEINIKYKYPATLGDQLIVGIKIDSIKRKSFTFYYEIWENAKNIIVAEARSVQVMYDYIEKRPIIIPEEWKKRVISFEGKNNVKVEI